MPGRARAPLVRPRAPQSPSPELSRPALMPAARSEGASPEGVRRSAENAPSAANPTFTADVYEKNQNQIAQADPKLANHQWGSEAFLEVWNQNRHRYEYVAEQTGIPAELVAAIHFRESSGDFSTYLHQGDPLGRPAVHVPTDIPVFDEWEDAAIHALNMKGEIQRDLSINAQTKDLAAMATYAEYYNGLGYDQRGVSSPYVFSGTDQYSKGKYIADGVYSSRAVDGQLGVVAMVQLANGDWQPGQNSGPGGLYSLGDRVLQKGTQGSDVKELQTLLNAQGARLVVDGDFGAGTDAALRDWQRRNGIAADGVAGPATVAALHGKPTNDAGGQPPTPPGLTPAPPPTPATPSAPLGFGSRTLRLGSTGADVEALQGSLVRLRHRLTPDGDFGPITHSAVTSFQRSEGLAADGVVGPNTTEAIRDALG